MDKSSAAHHTYTVHDGASGIDGKSVGQAMIVLTLFAVVWVLGTL